MRRPTGDALCLAGGLILGAARALAGAPPAPIAILISIDDLRADRVRPDLMPNLSALAREGVSFAAAYSQATWTLPSHASLLTSQYPWSHGAGGTDGPDDERPWRAPLADAPTLAQALDARGFASASFANCPFLGPEFGLVAGFDPRVVSRRDKNPLPRAGDWLLGGSGPRFLFAHTYGLHNYIDFADPPRDARGAWRCPPRVDSRLSWSRTLACPDATQFYDRAAYCLDRDLGALLSRLKASGLWAQALIGVVSDHGEGLCDGPPARRGHAQPRGYEPQTHVPWILKLPAGRLGGRRVTSPVELIDVAPTILAALGVPAPPAFQGRSRWPEMSGARRAPGPVFTESDRGLTVRDGSWAFLWSEGVRGEPYDLSADTDEIKNLVDARPERRAELESLLRAHAGRQRIGWHVAVRGRAGARFHLRVDSDRPLAAIWPAFTEPGDAIRVSTDGLAVEADVASQFDGDEDWLIVEASTAAADVRLEVRQDGAPLALSRAWLGSGGAPGPWPWALSRPSLLGLAVRAEAPEPRDGVSVWRAAVPGTALTRPTLDSAARQSLRAAGYLP